MVDLAKAIHLIRGRRAARVWTEPTAHAADSARIVGQGLGVSVSLEPRLRGIDLGVLAGLSREEAARRYPAAAASLEAWRRGEITSKELMVPGKEPVTSFEQRVRSALASMLGGPQQATVFIGTRSTLIMVTNLLELGCGFCYDAYVPYVVPNGAHCAWEWGHGTNRWVRLTDGPWK
jgi:probable phosphoglycerate mutase